MTGRTSKQIRENVLKYGHNLRAVKQRFNMTDAQLKKTKVYDQFLVDLVEKIRNYNSVQAMSGKGLPPIPGGNIDGPVLFVPNVTPDEEQLAGVSLEIATRADQEAEELNAFMDAMLAEMGPIDLEPEDYERVERLLFEDNPDFDLDFMEPLNPGFDSGTEREEQATKDESAASAADPSFDDTLGTSNAGEITSIMVAGMSNADVDEYLVAGGYSGKKGSIKKSNRDVWKAGMIRFAPYRDQIEFDRIGRSNATFQKNSKNKSPSSERRDEVRDEIIKARQDAKAKQDALDASAGIFPDESGKKGDGSRGDALIDNSGKGNDARDEPITPDERSEMKEHERVMSVVRQRTARLRRDAHTYYPGLSEDEVSQYLEDFFNEELDPARFRSRNYPDEESLWIEIERLFRSYEYVPKIPKKSPPKEFPLFPPVVKNPIFGGDSDVRDPDPARFDQLLKDPNTKVDYSPQGEITVILGGRSYLLLANGDFFPYPSGENPGALPAAPYRPRFNVRGEPMPNPRNPGVPPEFWKRVGADLGVATGQPEDPGGSSTKTEKPKVPPLLPKIPDIRPIPFVPPTKGKKEEPDPDKQAKEKKELADHKARTSGIAFLRPTFTKYHGIDLLQQTDKEALEDVREFDLFDLPIPEGESLDNPLFVHGLQAMNERFNKSGNPALADVPTAKQSSGQISQFFATSGARNGSWLYQSASVWTAVGKETQQEMMDANSALRPKVQGGSSNGVPWANPYENNYTRGFGEANRTEANDLVSKLRSLYAEPSAYNAIINPEIQRPLPDPVGVPRSYDSDILRSLRPAFQD